MLRTVLKRAAWRLRPRGRPVLSIVVIVYDMPRQAANTVRSLLADYQHGVDSADYELLIVENPSANLLAEDFVASLPDYCHYFLRRDPQASLAAAIDFGVDRARGERVCIMVDGARMVTPGVVRNLLLAHRALPGSVVAVPGYHLGRELQQTAVDSGYDEVVEQHLLASIGWPAQGYRLFDIACFSGSCRGGLFLPASESNCISVDRRTWQGLGGYDQRFDLPGGGLINLDFYKRACEYPGTTLVVLPGEGSFHQFHGGITTGGRARDERQAYIARSQAQYQALRGEPFSSPRVAACYLGELPPQAQKFVHLSAHKALHSWGEAPLSLDGT